MALIYPFLLLHIILITVIARGGTPSLFKLLLTIDIVFWIFMLDGQEVYMMLGCWCTHLSTKKLMLDNFCHL